jgi:adenylate kinase
MDRGDLVPDSLVMKMMEARLQQPDCAKGFILDGFPRTIPQAEALKRLLESLKIKLDFVVNLEVSTDVILDRLTTRRTCANPDCQEIYNIKSNPPTADGKCRKCGTKVVQRDDETEAAIMNRLDTYRLKTEPLIGFYRAEGSLKSFLSLSSRDTVAEIGKALSGLK